MSAERRVDFGKAIGNLGREAGAGLLLKQNTEPGRGLTLKKDHGPYGAHVGLMLAWRIEHAGMVCRLMGAVLRISHTSTFCPGLLSCNSEASFGSPHVQAENTQDNFRGKYA